MTISRSLSVAIPHDRARRLPRWAFEVMLLAGLYFTGELARGIARGAAPSAETHAETIVRLERTLHIFDEPTIQQAATNVGLTTLLGYAYLGLHLAGTAAVLVWVYRRRHHAYTRLRNALGLASALGVVGYAVFPTAPPRLAGLGIADTVTAATSVNLDSPLVSSLYNPYAAVPSMHIGFALIVGLAVARLAHRLLWRVAGAAYPVLVLFVIVATGNHFFFDAAAGAVVAVIALGTAMLAGRRHRRDVGHVSEIRNVHARLIPGRASLSGRTAPAPMRDGTQRQQHYPAHDGTPLATSTPGAPRPLQALTSSYLWRSAPTAGDLAWLCDGRASRLRPSPRPR